MLVSDTVIGIRVKGELHGHTPLADSGIRVHVQDAIVTLEGTVSDETLKVQAGQLAENVFGVEEVDNRIKIG